MRAPALRGATSWLDLGLALALAAWAVVDTLRADAPDPGLRAAIAGLAVVAVAVRRTFPGAAALWFAAGMATESLVTESPDEGGVLIGCVVLAYSVAVHAPRREAVLGAALMAMSLAVAISTDPSDSASNILPSALLFIAVPFAVGLTVRRRSQDIAALTLETEALAEEADLAVDAERRRIARELHDVVSHAVTLIAVQAEAGQAVLDDDPEAARRSLESIGRVSRDALSELALLLAVLRDDAGPGPEDGGLARLPSLVEGARAAGMTVSLDETGAATALAPAADRCAYRLVQEGLTNALRHLAGAQVRIELAHGPDGLAATVTSTGRPHASSYGGTGRGLTGLRERVAGLGGTFEAGAGEGGAFEIRAFLPAALTAGGR